MKKVLFVFNHPAPYKVRLLNELSKYFDLTVVFERDTNSDRNKNFYNEQNYLFKQVKIKGVKLGKENFLSSGLKNHLKKNKYDLIVMNGYSTFAEMAAINYLKRNRIPYVFYINGGFVNKKEFVLKRKLKNYFISGAEAYLSPDENSNNYLTYYGADSKKIINYPYSTIYNSEIFKRVLNSQEKSKARKQKGIPFEKVFVSSGQLIKRKNYLSLIKAWENEPINYGLYIFGEGPQRARALRYIKRNNLENVKLLGYASRQNLFEFYQISDCFVFPSNEDIYGHVINEALSQGLPVISTNNVNSAKKLIKNNKNGMIINSLDELKKTIDSILKIDCVKETIKTASENTIEKMVLNHVKTFNEVLDR